MLAFQPEQEAALAASEVGKGREIAVSMLLGKLAFSFIFAILAAGVISWPRTYRISASRFRAEALAGLLITRLGIFVTVFWIAHFAAQSDVEIYFREALAVASGKVPYRDFDTTYGPAFAYICAVPVWLWHSPKAIVLMSTLIDVVSAILWIRVAEQWFSEEVVRAATVLYLFSPLVVLDSSVAGQNQVWISLMLAISMGQLIHGRDWLSGIVMGLASIAVKVLAALFAPVLWFGAQRRLGWTIGFLLAVGLPLAAMAVIGGNVLFPLQNQGKAISSGNLPFLLSATGVDIARHSTSLNAVGILALFGMLILAHRRYSICREAWRLIPWISFMAFSLVFCSKKAGAYYLCTAFFPICVTVALAEGGRLRSIVYVLFSITSSLDLSLWFRWLQTSQLGFIRHWAMPPGLAGWQLAVFLTNDALLVACCAWYLGQSWRLLGTRQIPAACD